MDINLAESYPNPTDFIEIQTLYDPNFETSVTTACFDSYQELFWTGNSEVCKILIDFYGQNE
jgi:hypothetical protein